MNVLHRQCSDDEINEIHILFPSPSATRPICYGILMPKENVATGVLFVKVKDVVEELEAVVSAKLRRATRLRQFHPTKSLHPGNWQSKKAMSTTHDPTRHVNYLQQCLSQDKRSLGILVAAGCPVSIQVPTSGGTEPLIPDVQSLTDLVATKIRAGAHAVAFEKVLKHLGDDGHTSVNVETHLSFIRGLKAIAGYGTGPRSCCP
jgi:hypothetical protein